MPPTLRSALPEPPNASIAIKSREFSWWFATGRNKVGQVSGCMGNLKSWCTALNLGVRVSSFIGSSPEATLKKGIQSTPLQEPFMATTLQPPTEQASKRLINYRTD